ncbi:hypothetical protein BsIDN1_34500 [Bacillus safensis]|uniref:ABC transmembrane type-1 domain-containing protein n=1 Tax=Bacillus safensis TaxID=561879 RepID=A0A5S9MB58_BACIA|nr:hypothetical protein BsIDN1_34500 [Bacillus safensis]
MIITFSSAVLLIIFGSLAAYPLARRNTKLNKAVYVLFIAIMVIPPLTALVPLYKMVVQIGMMNTYQIAILNNVAAFLPLTIFLYAGFIRSTIPKELEEAARIDGAGTLRVFFTVVFRAFEAHYGFCINHCLRVYLERLSICYLLFAR